MPGIIIIIDSTKTKDFLIMARYSTVNHRPIPKVEVIEKISLGYWEDLLGYLNQQISY
jgi:hypothetical protein